MANTNLPSVEDFLDAYQKLDWRPAKFSYHFVNKDGQDCGCAAGVLAATRGWDYNIWDVDDQFLNGADAESRIAALVGISVSDLFSFETGFDHGIAKPSAPEARHLGAEVRRAVVARYGGLAARADDVQA